MPVDQTAALTRAVVVIAAALHGRRRGRKVTTRGGRASPTVCFHRVSRQGTNVDCGAVRPYTNLTTFENGEEAWTWIQRRLQETGDVNQVADLLVSDVEMPQIDGFHLTRNIKEHPELRKLYVLLFSSIMTEDNRNKGAAV